MKILLAALTLLLTAAPAQAAKRQCDDRPGSTLVADGTTRVYYTDKPDRGDPDSGTVTIRTCLIESTRKPRRLARYRNTLDGTLVPASARIARRWALVDVSEVTGVTAGHSLRLFDLRKGGQLPGGVYVDGADALDYVLTTTGAFAVKTPFEDELKAYDAAGEKTLVTGAFTDLAAAGRHVYWTAGDTAGSVRLGGRPTTFFER